MNIIEIFTDGACTGNPGPGGWGAVIRYGSEEETLSGGDPQTTNNRMEMLAAIKALEHVPEGSKVILTTDSQYIKNGITQWIHGWKRNGWKTAQKRPVKNKELWERLDRAASLREVEWRWVKGHSDHPENERADALARQAIKRAARR